MAPIIRANMPRLVCKNRGDVAEVFKFPTSNQAEYSVQFMSQALGVFQIGFCAQLSSQTSVQQSAGNALTKRVATILAASKQTYGATRFTRNWPKMALYLAVSVSND